MTPAPPPPLPGGLTVPLWFGWQHILAMVLVGIVAGAVALAAFAAGRARSSRGEWQAWLEGRSIRSGDDLDLVRDIESEGRRLADAADRHGPGIGCVDPPSPAVAVVDAGAPAGTVSGAGSPGERRGRIAQ